MDASFASFMYVRRFFRWLMCRWRKKERDREIKGLKYAKTGGIVDALGGHRVRLMDQPTYKEKDNKTTRIKKIYRVFYNKAK